MALQNKKVCEKLPVTLAVKPEQFWRHVMHENLQKWETLTQVRGAGCLFASPDLEEAFPKRRASFSGAEAVVLGGGLRGGSGTDGGLFPRFTHLFICSLRREIITIYFKITLLKKTLERFVLVFLNPQKRYFR